MAPRRRPAAQGEADDRQRAVCLLLCVRGVLAGGAVVSWTAVVPLKAAAARKTRLASVLAPEARVVLTDRMARHVIAVLRQVRSIERVLLLSPVPLSACDAEWIEDRGAGLNAELARGYAGLSCTPTCRCLRPLTFQRYSRQLKTAAGRSPPTATDEVPMPSLCSTGSRSCSPSAPAVF